MIRETLIKLADKFDQEGKDELADMIDEMLVVNATRPKAPLKKLDEAVKKDLLKFINKVKKNVGDSAEALEELFRRLRYFNIANIVKDMDLDKVLVDVKKTHQCMDSASKKMYELSYGRRPGKSDLEQMAKDVESDAMDSSSSFFKGREETKPRWLDREVEEDELEALEGELEQAQSEESKESFEDETGEDNA